MFLKRNKSVGENGAYSYKVVFQDDSPDVRETPETANRSNASDALVWSNFLDLHQKY